jgi:hypothetical protein
MDYLEIVRSQYLAALEMLKHAISTSPDAVWNDPADNNRSWYVAYHALFFTHYYLQDSEAGFEVWQGHWDEGNPGLPPMDAPYSQADMLEYLAFCQQEVNRRVPVLNPEAPAAFARRNMNKFELQIYNIRHIMQHAGELFERNGTRAGVEGTWVGMKHD